MSQVKYQTKIEQIGPHAQDFIDEGILVFFGMNAPEELTEFAILHHHTKLLQPIQTGDTLYIGDEAIEILCIGDVANENLSNLGHFVIKFNGLTQPEMPGDISTPKCDNLPSVEPGTAIKFVSAG